MENGNARNDFGSSEDSCAVGTELIFSDKRLCVWITESQKVGGWKGPLWVTQSNPLPKQGHLQQAAQDLVQGGLEYLQRRRLHSIFILGHMRVQSDV